MRSTLKLIAAETGYSIATVSRALSGSPKIASEAKRTILAAARRCGYRTESRNVALIVPHNSFSGYFGVLLEHLFAELSPQGFCPVVLTAGELEVLEELRFCGAISVMAQDGLEKYWGKRHIMPLVCINTSPRHLDGIFTVGSNDAQAMRLAVEHLIGLGHRRIGRLGGPYSFGNPNNWNSFARDRNFRRLMAEHGLDPELWAIGSDTPAEPLKELLGRGITALIILNEGMELEALRALRLLGCRVPEDLSVVSWSIPGTGAALVPPLTSLEQDFELLVRHVCTLFHRLIAGEAINDDVLVDYHFRIRRSTAAPGNVTRQSYAGNSV